MRSFLGWVILVAILGGLAFVAAPIVARPLVVAAVRAASPFGTAPLDVDVTVDTLGLLRGTIDDVHVTAANLTSGRVTIGRLDVTAQNVGIGDHAFASMTGALESVVIRQAGGGEISVRQVALSGSSDAAEAEASLGRDATIGIVRGALAVAGLPVDDVELVDGGVRLSLLGQKTDIAIGVEAGAVAIAGSIAGAGSIIVFGPEPGEPWHVTAVSVSPDGLEVHAEIDLGELLRPR